MINLPENVAKLFESLAKDADNWSGTPLFGEDGTYKPVLGYKEDRGLLTKLKRAGLVETFKSDGCLWVRFTEAGRVRAVELNIDPKFWC